MPKKQPRLPGFVVYEDGGYDRELAKASVGKGWAGLIDEVFDAKESMNLANVKIVQVKEKYAGLRIYIDGYEMDKNHPVYKFEQLIHNVGERSYKICEECGKPGMVRGTGWIFTACDEHSRGQAPHKEYTDE